MEILASRRKVARLGALYKACCGERAWKDVGGSLERPHYLNRTDHSRKIGCRRQKTDIGKYSVVNRTVDDWNRLPAEVLQQLPCNSSVFKNKLKEGDVSGALMEAKGAANQRNVVK